MKNRPKTNRIQGGVKIAHKTGWIEIECAKNISAKKMDNFENFFRNPNEIYHLGSKIPPETLDNDCILGIDEAGRGPVLGIRFVCLQLANPEF